MTWGQELQLEHERAFKEGLEQGIEQGIEKGIEQGIEKGIEQGKILLSKQMINDNIPNEIIMKYFNLTEEQIEEMRNINNNE